MNMQKIRGWKASVPHFPVDGVVGFREIDKLKEAGVRVDGGGVDCFRTTSS